MKLQFKALSLTLGLVALLGVGTSVKSGTPDISGTENSVEVAPDGIELEASEDIEDAELEASEEIEDAETAEIETPELEAAEDAESIDESSSIEGTVDDSVESVESVEDTVDGVQSQF